MKFRWLGAQRCAPACLMLMLLCSTFCYAFNNHQPFDIAADVLDYIDDTQEIVASGHVVIVQSSSTLHADLVRYDRRNRRLIARGKVNLTEGGNILLGDQMDYDLVQEKGIVLGGKGISSSWFFQGTSWLKQNDYYLGRNGSFTSCDLIDPHYHIRASRVHLIPDRMFWSWNNVFYADTLPVMYSPFMYKFLDDRRVTFQAQPGSDSLLGSFAKTTTTMRLGPTAYNKVFLDHYTVAGTGFGDELNLSNSGKYKGSFFGYYINPHPEAVLSGAPTGPQYNARASVWDRLSPTTQLQANINLRQNVSFNTQYFTQDPNQSQNDINSSLALTQQTTSYNQSISVSRLDAPDANETGAFAPTHMQSASVPSYSFTLFDRPLWQPNRDTGSTRSLYASLIPGTTGLVKVEGPLMRDELTGTRPYGPLMPEDYATFTRTRLVKPSKVGSLNFNMTGSAQSQFQRSDERLHSGAQTVLNLNQSFPFARDWSYGYRVSPQINWQDKGPTSNVSTDTQKGYTGRMTFGNSLRWRPLSSLTIDTGHTLTERMKPNALEFARDTQDHGVESNSLGFSLNYRPNVKVLLRTSSGFDLRKLDDESFYSYTQRKWSQWTTDLTYTPNWHWENYISNSLAHYPERTTSWQASTRYQTDHKTSVSTAFVYNRSQPGFVTWNQSMGFYVAPGWRVDAGVNALVPSYSFRSTRDANLINTSLVLVREMHCWQTQFIYRDTPPFSREYSILFNLKMGGNPKKPIADEKFESQFYPWRNRAVDPTIR